MPVMTQPDLLRYRVFAVNYHSFIPCALYLRQPRLVNNPGTLELFIKNVDIHYT
jgi:hypothetical protein